MFLNYVGVAGEPEAAQDLCEAFCIGGECLGGYLGQLEILCSWKLLLS